MRVGALAVTGAAAKERGARSSLFLPGVSESSDTVSALSPHEVAYRGLIKLHAAELVKREYFLRSGRISPSDVHAVQMDLAQLDRTHPLDETIDLILARTDELQLEREAQA